MTDRLSFDVTLAPVLGSMFQPTGFPDIGPATFTRFDGGEQVPSLLVESVQSMANRLEATAWDDVMDEPVAEVAGMAHVRVVRAGTDEFLTSSRLEAHRLASPFVYDATLDGRKMQDVIRERLALAPDTPLQRRTMVRALARLDPFCLLHGVFFSRKEWPGQPKFERAISAVIEARGVHRAVSGGRKADRVRHQLDSEIAGGTAEGYGSVPFHRTEWTAQQIVASFVVDLRLIRSYGLPAAATELLQVVAQWEIRRFLESGLRLRTACDLEPVSEVRSRRGSVLPAEKELADRMPALVKESVQVLGEDGALTVQWRAPAKKGG